MKIHPVGLQFFCTDRETDMTKPKNFRNFANAPNNRIK